MKIKNYVVIFPILLVIFCCLFPIRTILAGESEWSGVDETVVEKYAEEHNREAITPLINTDQGDLLLFVFLIGGTVGGFAAGYCWRILMVEKAPKINREKQKITG